MIAQLFRRWWSVSHGLTVLVVTNVVVLAMSVVGRILDDTIVTGAPVWDKPAKFAISFLLYAPTLLWLFGLVDRTRWVRWGVGILGWSMVLEIALITFQALRGRASHFNNETSFDAAIFQAMAAGVGIFTIAGIMVGLIMARRRLGTGLIGFATKIAVPMMTVGAVLGFIMTLPQEGQMPDDAIVGGHTNGALDGGPGIPFLGWSSEFGDFRVAHFLGLHSLQIVPLAAVAIAAIARRRVITDRQQRGITLLAALAWSGLVATSLLQAFRELPVTALDGPTALALITLTIAPAAAVVALIVSKPTRPEPITQIDHEPVLAGASSDRSATSHRSPDRAGE